MSSCGYYVTACNIVAGLAYATRQARGQIQALRYIKQEQHFEHRVEHVLRIAFGQLGTQSSHRSTTDLTRQDRCPALTPPSFHPPIKSTKGNIHLEKVENVSASDHAGQQSRKAHSHIMDNPTLERFHVDGFD